MTGGIGGGECECIITCKCGCWAALYTVCYSQSLSLVTSDRSLHLKLFYVITTPPHTPTHCK